MIVTCILWNHLACECCFYIQRYTFTQSLQWHNLAAHPLLRQTHTAIVQQHSTLGIRKFASHSHIAKDYFAVNWSMDSYRTSRLSSQPENWQSTSHVKLIAVRSDVALLILHKLTVTSLLLMLHQGFLSFIQYTSK